MLDTSSYRSCLLSEISCIVFFQCSATSVAVVTLHLVCAVECGRLKEGSIALNDYRRRGCGINRLSSKYRDGFGVSVPLNATLVQGRRRTGHVLSFPTKVMAFDGELGRIIAVFLPVQTAKNI